MSRKTKITRGRTASFNPRRLDRASRIVIMPRIASNGAWSLFHMPCDSMASTGHTPTLCITGFYLSRCTSFRIDIPRLYSPCRNGLDLNVRSKIHVTFVLEDDSRAAGVSGATGINFRHRPDFPTEADRWKRNDHVVISQRTHPLEDCSHEMAAAAAMCRLRATFLVICPFHVSQLSAAR